MRPRFAYVLPTRSFAETRDLAERAEGAGWDTVAVEDHFFMRSPMEEPTDPRLDVSYFFCRFTDGATMEHFARDVIARL